MLEAFNNRNCAALMIGLYWPALRALDFLLLLADGLPFFWAAFAGPNASPAKLCARTGVYELLDEDDDSVGSGCLLNGVATRGRFAS